jgi:hypothetical protein
MTNGVPIPAAMAPPRTALLETTMKILLSMGESAL